MVFFSVGQVLCINLFFVLKNIFLYLCYYKYIIQKYKAESESNVHVYFRTLDFRRAGSLNFK